MVPVGPAVLVVLGLPAGLVHLVVLVLPVVLVLHLGTLAGLDTGAAAEVEAAGVPVLPVQVLLANLVHLGRLGCLRRRDIRQGTGD